MDTGSAVCLGTALYILVYITGPLIACVHFNANKSGNNWQFMVNLALIGQRGHSIICNDIVKSWYTEC